MNRKHYLAACRWMDENPMAYTLFDRYALEMASTGQKFGAKLIAERVRWECRLRKVGEFLWNNNHTKYVSMRWRRENPKYAHLVSVRNGEAEEELDLFREIND